jgi:hypothetical protein
MDMTRFRRNSAMAIALTAISASAWLMAAAGVAFGDDLKGYSIDATYITLPIPGVVIAGELPRHGLSPVQHHDRVYVSVVGNVFDYSDVFGGAHVSHGGHEAGLDKARALSNDRMRAWTTEPGRLLKITKEIEGFLVETFVVDPGKSACSVSYELRADPQTGRTVMRTMGGETVEIKAYNVSSATCTVRKGNIFASDQ